MAKYSEDVEVRCKTCGRVMGTVTVRSEIERDHQKMIWWQSQLRCYSCIAERTK